RHVRIEAHRLLHVLETMNAPAIYLQNNVAGANASLLGGAARLDLPDLGRCERLAIGHEQDRQGDDGKDEIRRRAGSDYRGALAQSLVMKRHLPFGRTETRKARSRQTRTGIAVAEHLHVTAQRDRAEFPACSGSIPPAE